MTDAARLVFPALRWDAIRGDWEGADRIAEFAELGVGGYIVFGGTAGAAAELTAELRRASRHPVLVGADLERGAGQQFDGATPLPPAAALASLDDLDATRRAGALTGREARALGVDWVYAPVADVDVEPENPIVGTRAFGREPAAAARHVAAWIDGCRSSGPLACAKHFPGHGRTTADSHMALPVVDATAAVLGAELAPFRAAIDAGVDSVMTAHVAYPALDDTGAPATLSKPIVDGVLRQQLGFQGLVVTDALIMEGVDATPEEAAVRAVAAGCDALLYPPDPAAVAARLETARGAEVSDARLTEAIRRVAETAERVDAARASAPEGRWGDPADRSWALDRAVDAVRMVRGDAADLGRTFDLVIVDDDVGGPYPPPSRHAFPATLTKAGRSPIPVDEAGARAALVAVYADIRGYKGRPGVSDAARSAVRAAVEAAPSSLVVLFGTPRLAGMVPGENLVCAWGGEPLMQEAAAVYLAGGAAR